MSESKELDVIVNEDGSVRFIYDDALAELIPPGYTCPIQRASHVEYDNALNGWTADMRPALELMTPQQVAAFGPIEMAACCPPLTLGPFATRAEALAAEVAWLKEWAGV